MRDHFANCFGEDAIKSRYRELCRLFHPDLNPGKDTTRTMQDVNAQYKEALRAEYRKTKSDDEAADAVEADERAAEILAKIVALPEIVIEIVGVWLWVTGDTFPVRDLLKAAGLKWASKKRAWYWHAPENKCRGGRKNLDEIRATYGARTVATMSFARLG